MKKNQVGHLNICFRTQGIHWCNYFLCTYDIEQIMVIRIFAFFFQLYNFFPNIYQRLWPFAPKWFHSVKEILIIGGVLILIPQLQGSLQSPKN